LMRTLEPLGILTVTYCFLFGVTHFDFHLILTHVHR
jgi:hypothetical protein